MEIVNRDAEEEEDDEEEEQSTTHRLLNKFNELLIVL